MFISIHPEHIDDRLIDQVVEILKKGELIIIPTDSVYAVACNALNKNSLNELAKYKNVKINKANFSLICSSLSDVSDYVLPLDRSTFRIMKQHLPGPFTFILEANKEVSKLFDVSKKEIGVRIPNQPIVLEIVNRLGNPLAVTSLHDEKDLISDYFTDPYSIFERYENEIPLIIDGGYGQIEPTTIVNCTSGEPEIIRQGIGQLID